MKDCKWCHCEFCVNDACPAVADYCPVAGEYWELCKFYEQEEET